MFIAPKFVARVNLKPLLSLDEVAQLSPGRVLRSLRNEILKTLRGMILDEAFSPAAKKALARGLKTKMGPKSLTVIATHPAFFPLVKGRERGQMKWLMKAKSPIPIVLDSGEVIFRSASAKSMADGRWIHPGHQPTTLIERARRQARSVVKKRMKKALQKQLRAAMAKA